MGLFARLLRPPAPAQIPPTHISKPRVLGNGKGAAANKENVHPNVKHRKGKTNKSSSSSSGSGSNSKKKKKSSKKKGFWGRKKGRAEPAPKLSLFLQQNPPPQNDVASIETTSLTASHTTGSNTLSSKSMSTSSTLSLTTNPLHLQSQQSAEPDADNIALRIRQGGEVKATSTSRSVTKTKSTHVNSTSLSGDTVEAPKKSSSKKKKRKDSNIKPSDTTKESSKIKKSHMKGPDSTSTNTATLTHAPSLPTAKEERVATPYPQSSETKSKSKSTPKKPRTESTLVQDYSKTKAKSKAVVKEKVKPSLAVGSKISQTQGPKLTSDAAEVNQEPTLSQNNKIHKIEDEDLSIASNDVVFDDLSIDEEIGDEDFFSFPHEENGAQTSFQITNMKSLSLLSPLASDSLSRGGIESEFEPHLPDRTSTGEFAVIGSNTSSGDAVMRDVSGLQDIIDEVEKDMMELDSLFSSPVSKTSDRHEKKKTNGWAGNTSGWISNGAMQGNSSTHSEESSIISFDSDEFAEDDDHEHRPVTRVTNFQITTIIEENESDSEDPLEAALKRGEMLSKDAKETNSIDGGLISMDTSSGVENSNKHSRENSYSRQGGYGSVHTDSDLSDSFASTSQSASPPSSLEKSLNKKLKRPEIPRRKITKTLSWKEKDEIFTYAKPFKSINLEMALEMVRTYDPRYGTQDRASPPPRLNHVQKPLKSILKKSKSWSPQEFSNDDSSISQESSSSTLSSNATSESVQYMVGKLKIEAARRRRKINIRRSTHLM